MTPQATLPLLLVVACGGTTGQREIRYPVVGIGEPSAPFTVGAWEVTLTTAQIGFGPAYFCATAAASSDLCPAAVSQFAHSAAINGLDSAPQTLGEGDGETGTVRSATYDFAFTWFATQKQAGPAPGAPGGNSARFAGTAINGATTLRFVADIDLVPHFQGTRAVQGAPVAATLEDSDLQLSVGVQPSLWWTGVDFDALALLSGDPIQVLPGSRAYEAVILGMIANARPSLVWARAQ
jgi:hypothetical protein